MLIEITNNKKFIDQIVEIHLQTFEGFFLTFLGKGFLKQLYMGFMSHEQSNVIVAIENGKILGFIAYSENMSNFYKYLIKKKLILFAWYALLAFFRNPKVLFRLLRAFGKSDEVNRKEKYIELASIGVLPQEKGKHIGTNLISFLKEKVDFNIFSYISLDTDAINNDYANNFYIKNGFELIRTYETREGRKMNEYQFKK